MTHDTFQLVRNDLNQIHIAKYMPRNCDCHIDNSKRPIETLEKIESKLDKIIELLEEKKTPDVRLSAPNSSPLWKATIRWYQL